VLASKKRQLATSICDALAVHTTIEEEIFYPAFLQATEDKDIHHMFAAAKKSEMDLDALGEELLARRRDLQSQSKGMQRMANPRAASPRDSSNHAYFCATAPMAKPPAKSCTAIEVMLPVAVSTLLNCPTLPLPTLARRMLPINAPVLAL
jgi:hypothetical protein